MDNLLKKQVVSGSRRALDCVEECAVSVDYALPDYCPDVAVVLKCLIAPRVQNRQWSGDQLLLDGTADIRVLYLDEERRCVREVEFSQSLSCSLRADGRVDAAPVQLDLSTKYVNCRAVGPRRLEVRGAVCVKAVAECAAEMPVMTVRDGEPLYTRCETVSVTAPKSTAERILAVSEVLDFPEDLPPAEMLLGGECSAVIRECKLLPGKAIVKGDIYLHQLYTDDTVSGTTHCLDYTVPYSQILDVEGAQEGQLYTANVLLLSDTQRCAVGQTGSNTVLEITVKLLVQLQIYETLPVPLLLDAYHSRCPVTLDTGEQKLCACLGSRWEMSVLPMQMDLPAASLEELVDVWVQPLSLQGQGQNGTADLSGRLLVCMLVRDTDGQIAYFERAEEYQLEYPCEGNAVEGKATVAGIKYRVTEDKLELQVTLHIALQMYQQTEMTVIQGASLQTDMPYPSRRATALLYYADAGESVWDIGRHCRTAPEEICRENGLTGDVLTQPAVLVVPL